MSAEGALPLCSEACLLASGCLLDCEGLDRCEAYKKLDTALQQYFNFTSFREGQLKAMLSVLHGNDVFVRMATGGGKSLCMFLPPLAASSVAVGIVISPLIGLMDEQVEKLSSIGVPAIRAHRSEDYDRVASGEFRIVFMSPETAVNAPWRSIYECHHFQKNLVSISVDEAHCIHEWGQKFRTSFREIGGLRALTKVPYMALTASAPAAVEEDIVSSLGMNDPVQVKLGLNRPNIYLSVNKGSTGQTKDLSSLAEMLRTCRDLRQVPKTLVFVRTKSMAVKVSTFLQQHASRQGIVSMYHAKLSPETKSHLYHRFSSPSLRCPVATVAFGMGMDVADVELVVVYGLPASVLQLYQLIGRAGRGGCEARAHLIYTAKELKDTTDKSLADFVVNKENCRRRDMLKKLGSEESLTGNAVQCCDVCSRAKVPYKKLDCIQPAGNTRCKRRSPVRRVSKELKEELHLNLIMERNRIAASSSGFAYLGVEVLCPSNVISQLCKLANSVNCLDDVKIHGLRPQLYERFYSVIVETLHIST